MAGEEYTHTGFDHCRRYVVKSGHNPSLSLPWCKHIRYGYWFTSRAHRQSAYGRKSQLLPPFVRVHPGHAQSRFPSPPGAAAGTTVLSGTRGCPRVSATIGNRPRTAPAPRLACRALQQDVRPKCPQVTTKSRRDMTAAVSAKSPNSSPQLDHISAAAQDRGVRRSHLLLETYKFDVRRRPGARQSAPARSISDDRSCAEHSPPTRSQPAGTACRPGDHAIERGGRRAH